MRGAGESQSSEMSAERGGARGALESSEQRAEASAEDAGGSARRAEKSVEPGVAEARPAEEAEVVRFEVALRPESREQGAEQRTRVVELPLSAAARRDRGELKNGREGAAAVQRLGVFVGAAAGVASGIVPGVAPLFGLHIGASLGPLCAALRLGFAPPQAAQLQVPAGVGGSVALALAALEGGVRFEGFGLEFPLVVGVEPGLFFASAHGVPDSSAQPSDWLATYLSPGISHTWGERLRAFVRLDGLFALRRPRFAIDAPGAALVFHQPDRISARLYLGLDIILR